MARALLSVILVMSTVVYDAFAFEGPFGPSDNTTVHSLRHRFLQKETLQVPGEQVLFVYTAVPLVT